MGDRSEVDLTIALRLLDDRRFLRDRSRLEVLMRELLAHAGNPFEVRPSAPLPPKPFAPSHIVLSADVDSIGFTTVEPRCCQVPAVVAQTEAKGGDLGVFLGRLNDLVALEPVDSPATSRIVGKAIYPPRPPLTPVRLHPLLGIDLIKSQHVP